MSVWFPYENANAPPTATDVFAGALPFVWSLFRYVASFQESMLKIVFVACVAFVASSSVSLAVFLALPNFGRRRLLRLLLLVGHLGLGGRVVLGVQDRVDPDPVDHVLVRLPGARAPRRACSRCRCTGSSRSM